MVPKLRPKLQVTVDVKAPQDGQLLEIKLQAMMGSAGGGFPPVVVDLLAVSGLNRSPNSGSHRIHCMGLVYLYLPLKMN